MLRCYFLWPILCGLTLTLGCSDKNKTAGRASVSGSVTLKGVPLSEGVVQFSPLEKQTTTASVVLVGGNFSISSANGLEPGMYLVRIASGEPQSKPPEVNAVLTPSGNNLPGSAKTDAKKPVIPPEWGDKSKQQVEVKPDGPNKFDFDIK